MDGVPIEDLWQAEYEAEVWQTAFWFAWYAWSEGEPCDEYNLPESILHSSLLAVETDMTPTDKINQELEEAGWDKERFKMIMEITKLGLDKDFPPKS